MSSGSSMSRMIDALSLDVRVLDSLLSQQRCSHRRTKYFQRMSMALRAVRRHAVADLPIYLEALQQAVRSFAHDRQKEGWKQRAKKGGVSGFFQKELTAGNGGGGDDSGLGVVESAFVGFRSLIREGFPEILSRIRYATESLLTEISRGFFLPFCTVALGALARIRAVCMRLGNLTLVDLRSQYVVIENFVPDQSLRSFDFMVGKEFEASLNVFVEVLSSEDNPQRPNSGVPCAKTLQQLGLSSRTKSGSVQAIDGENNHSHPDLDLIMKEMHDGSGSRFSDAGSEEGAAELFSDIGTNVTTGDLRTSMDREVWQQTKISGSAVQSKVFKKKQDAQAKAPKVDRKRKPADINSPTAGPTSKSPSKKRKKKKKEKSGGDFFDALFD